MDTYRLFSDITDFLDDFANQITVHGQDDNYHFWVEWCYLDLWGCYIGWTSLCQNIRKIEFQHQFSMSKIIQIILAKFYTFWNVHNFCFTFASIAFSFLGDWILMQKYFNEPYQSCDRVTITLPHFNVQKLSLFFEVLICSRAIFSLLYKKRNVSYDRNEVHCSIARTDAPLAPP